MARNFLLLLVAVLSSHLFACAGNITMPLAALTDSNTGGIVNVYIEAFPSEGREVLVSIPPYYGTDLQRSVSDAADYAGIENCTVVVRFGQFSDYMEGPSAGAAFAAALYALRHNVSFVHMPVITGVLGPGGSITPVGGTYEKAMAAAKAGIPLFVCPEHTVYDYVVLRQVEEKTGMRIIYVNNMSEMLDFLIYNKTPSKGPGLSYSAEAEHVADYPADANSAAFIPIARKMAGRANDMRLELRKENAEKWINEYYLALLDDCEKLFGKNYVYTAANNAFLAYVDMKTLAFVYGVAPDYRGEKEYVESCISGLERPLMTKENLEWVVAFDLRKAWAEDNLRRSNLSEKHLAEEEWFFYHDLVYAEAWCLAARDFAAAAREKNRAMNALAEVDESLFADIASDYLKRANSTVHSADTKKRFEIAKRLYDEGRYAAAIFDFAYVVSMDESAAALAGMDDAEIENEVQKMLAAKPNFMWPDIYRSQAVFLTGIKNPDYLTAYQLFAFSNELDAALAEMFDAAKPIPKAETEPEKGPGYGSCDIIPVAAALLATFILFAVVLLYILQKTKRRSHEREHKPSYRASGRERKRFA